MDTPVPKVWLVRQIEEAGISSSSCIADSSSTAIIRNRASESSPNALAFPFSSRLLQYSNSRPRVEESKRSFVCSKIATFVSLKLTSSCSARFLSLNAHRTFVSVEIEGDREIDRGLRKEDDEAAL
jgi:hypothetical protein